jgi:L-histidine N-alpha-methyltransferase
VSPPYQVLSRRDPGGESVDERSIFAAEVREGLGGSPRTLSSKWFYDDRGSRLFQRITEVDEYYLTRCEEEVLRAHRQELAGLYQDLPLDLVELGVGDGRKTALLLESFLEARVDVHYRPVDISEGAMAGLLASLRDRFGNALQTEGIVAEHFDALRWLQGREGRALLVLFLGSNIGNFTAAGTAVFLRHLREALIPGDRVLIGFDLAKDPATVLRAYNDSQGVTREFNLNLLDRINRELGGDFDRTAYRHEARWDPADRAVQSWLVSRRPQTVRIEAADLELCLDEGEGIRTEFSHKYTREDISAFAAAAGFTQERLLLDRRGWFADALWRA